MLDHIPIELLEAHGQQPALIAARRIGRPASALLSVPRLMIAMSSSLRFAAAVVAKQFGAGCIRQPTRPDGSDAVDHSSQTHVVDRHGQLAGVLPHGTPPEKIAAAMRKLL